MDVAGSSPVNSAIFYFKFPPSLNQLIPKQKKQSLCVETGQIKSLTVQHLSSVSSLAFRFADQKADQQKRDDKKYEKGNNH